MASNSTPFTTPVGRLVWGNPFTPQAVTDDDNKPKIDPATGQPITEYAIGVAFAKNDPAWHAFYALMKQADKDAWPQFHDANGSVLPGVLFRDKITDGDGYDTKGQPHSRKEGYAGHFVVKFVSRFAPSCYAHNGTAWAQLTDTNAIKRGYYVRVDGTMASNSSAQSPGMYRNLGMVALAGYGPEITTGPDANERFGSAAAPLPPGASPTPIAPSAPMPMQAAPAMPVPPQHGAVAPTPSAPMQAPTYAAPPVAAPSTTTYPSNPPPAPAAPVAPPYSGFMPKTLLPHVQGTYEAYVAAGWTDEQLRAQGLMA